MKLEIIPDSILIFGRPKTGKTYAVCSMIRYFINHNAKVHYISTDNGLLRTFKEYFSTEAEKYAKEVNFYLLNNLDNMIEVVKLIRESVKPEDLIVIDLISDLWEMAQQKFIEDASSGNIVNFIQKASKNPKTFGLFDSTKWQYIKKVDDVLIRNFVIAPPCSVIGIASAKDIDIDQIYNAESYEKYKIFGCKPAGEKHLEYKFNTLIYIGELKSQKYFVVYGARGNKIPYKRINYEQHWYRTFLEQNKK